MSKKLQGNGLWESSRMMLPEHKEQILHRHREQHRRTRPQLDPDQFACFSQLITHSLMQGDPLQFTLFDEWQDQHITGRVERIDPLRNRLHLLCEEDSGEARAVVIRLADIVDITDPLP